MCEKMEVLLWFPHTHSAFSWTDVSLMCLQEGEGSEPEINPLALLPVLAEFVRLKDPGMLILEVSGLAAKYPDIR